MEIKVINHSGFSLPSYATDGSSGLDIQAKLDNSLVLKSLERVLIPTGLFFEIPVGFEGQVRPRSGLAAKQGITVLNSPGTVDADYRGELKVILVNLSTAEFTINPGERIAQIVFSKVEQIRWNEVTVVSETDRGSGGFGHTGK
ncbi:MAG TPA: dUTP diphosphatase [Williamwhitmania sp.]|nr:dUTP diphosphatase [Williamwhitmania sp.]